ncbi:hypothetical protein ACQKCU_18050 [Heyndrickxia sporothermodurans]
MDQFNKYRVKNYGENTYKYLRLEVNLFFMKKFVGLISSYSNAKDNINLEDGPSQEELLEETLYTRYYSYLEKTYSDFIMCPRINIERINGDKRRHIVNASALNYAAHHGDIPFDRIYITLTDSPENGVKINKITIQKGISENESRLQCRQVD